MATSTTAASKWESGRHQDHSDYSAINNDPNLKRRGAAPELSTHLPSEAYRMHHRFDGIPKSEIPAGFQKNPELWEPPKPMVSS